MELEDTDRYQIEEMLDDGDIMLAKEFLLDLWRAKELIPLGEHKASLDAVYAQLTDKEYLDSVEFIKEAAALLRKREERA